MSIFSALVVTYLIVGAVFAAILMFSFYLVDSGHAGEATKQTYAMLEEHLSPIVKNLRTFLILQALLLWPLMFMGATRK